MFIDGSVDSLELHRQLFYYDDYSLSSLSIFEYCNEYFFYAIELPAKEEKTNFRRFPPFSN